MNRIMILQEIRIMRFKEVYGWWTESRLTQEEAALQLGMSESTFRRYCRRHEAEGAEGLYVKTFPDKKLIKIMS